MSKPLLHAQQAELERRMSRQRVLAEQDTLTVAEKAELLELSTSLTAVFCTGWPVAERLVAAIGQPVLDSLEATKLRALESGTGAFFDFSGSPSGGTRFWITFDEETDLCRVQLMRRHGTTRSEQSRLTLIQGKSGVALLDLSQVVQTLSRHGARR